ncbi:MAG: hypothetical protein ACC656_11410 [Candidatus Heimdallarchaeota archaeon]
MRKKLLYATAILTVIMIVIFWAVNKPKSEKTVIEPEVTTIVMSDSILIDTTKTKNTLN